MKFSINSKELEKLLAKAFLVVPNRSPLQELESFLLELSDNRLTVTGTDQDMIIRTSTSIASNDNFSALVNARLFYDIIRSLPDTSLSFESTADDRMRLTTDWGNYNISLMDSSGFPVLPQPANDITLSVESAWFKKALDDTSFAISNEPMRPAMTGLLMELSEDGLRFVATDGHKLVRLHSSTHTFPDFRQVIIPEKAVQILAKLVSSGTTDIVIGDVLASFTFDNVSFTTRLIGQKFPDYNSVIPLENENILKISSTQLCSAVKRLMNFTAPQFPQIRLALSQDKLELSANNPEAGASGNESLAAEYNGTPFEIGFNPGTFYEVISHIHHEEMLIRLNNPTKAVLVEPAEKAENESILMLVMPVRLNS